MRVGWWVFVMAVKKAEKMAEKMASLRADWMVLMWVEWSVDTLAAKKNEWEKKVSYSYDSFAKTMLQT